MAPHGTTSNRDPDPVGYQVYDLTIDLAPRRVRRAGTVIPLKSLSFDLLVALVRAAPNLLSFDQLSERVWPGLVVTPETIVQRVKLLRGALGDDPHAPRYIEGVRGRGYRMLAEVRALTERPGTPESVVPPSPAETKEEESQGVHSGTAATGAASLSAPIAPPPAAPRFASWVPVRAIGGTLIILVLLGASWAMVHYRGMSKPAERTSVVVSPVIHSLVVLPLENLSGDKEQEYFADGMTDTLITDLAQIGSLRIISRTSAMQFKGSKEPLPKIGRALGVDAVVEGTVARSKDRVRITAQLLEASSDRHLWAKSYERDLKDILVLQDEIAQDVAEQIRVKLTPKERSLLMQVHTVDPEAHDAYLRGRYWWHKSTAEDEWKGLDFFQKAIAEDPKYALAYAGVADSFLYLGHHRGLPPREAFPKAKEAANKALELDPSLAEAHTSLAIVKFSYDLDWSGAEDEFKQAIALNPNWATAHDWYSHYLVAMGRADEAVKEIERARELDPYSGPITAWRGAALYNARRYDDALRQYQQAFEMFPRWGVIFYNEIGGVYEQKKMFAEAFTAHQQAWYLGETPNKEAIAAELASVYKRSGYRGYLHRTIQILQQLAPDDIDVVRYLAHLYLLLDDEDHAITYFERAYDQGDPWLLYMPASPEVDSIRSSPRFRDLVRRIGFPPSPSHKN